VTTKPKLVLRLFRAHAGYRVDPQFVLRCDVGNDAVAVYVCTMHLYSDRSGLQVVELYEGSEFCLDRESVHQFILGMRMKCSETKFFGFDLNFQFLKEMIHSDLKELRRVLSEKWLRM